MKANYFECKIRREKTDEHGMPAKVTESYLVDAFTFTEAEARLIEEMTPYIGGEFTIKDIKRANYSDVFTTDDPAADKYYKCKLMYIYWDEKRDVEKREASYILVQAADLRDAVKRIDEEMKSVIADYEIVQVAETTIVDVFRYQHDDVNTGASYDAETPVVRQFLTSLPEGMKTTIMVAGRKIVVDKTGSETKVIPQDDQP